MTQDEMDRTMQFILQQQAQFATSMQEVREEIRQLGKRHGELQDAVITITGVVGTMTGMVGTMTGMVGRLGDAQTEIARSHQELAKAQAHTEERLSTFITFVERYISEAGRN